MSTSAIRQIVSDNGLNDNFMIHYDFSTYSGDYALSSTGNRHGLIERSSEAALSGAIHEAGYFNMSGGYNGANQSLLIQNDTGIFDRGSFLNNENFTMLFRGSHKTKFDIGQEEQMPLNRKDIIFSNLTGYGYCISGWEVGINSANKLYFKSQDNLEPLMFSYSDGVYGENIWGVKYINKNVSLFRYDPYTEKVKSESQYIAGGLSNGGEWRIGSGILDGGSQAISTGINNGNTSASRITDFIFFDKALTTRESSLICKSMLRDVSYSTGDGAYSYSGLSGYSSSAISSSGALFESGYLSGYALSATGSVTIERASELSGLVPSGSPYFSGMFLATGLSTAYTVPEQVYGSFLNTGSAFTGITGLDYSEQEILLSGLVPVYVFSVVSGSISEGSAISYVLTGITGYNSALVSPVYGDEGNSILYPKSFSFLGAKDSNDFIEMIDAGDSYVSEQVLNRELSTKTSSVFYGKTLSFPSEYNYEEVNLFVNGVFMRYGDLIKTVDVHQSYVVTSDGENYFEITCDSTGLSEITTTSTGIIQDGKVISLSFSGDWAITGGIEVVLPYDFSSSSDIANLVGLVDLYQSGERQQLSITGLSQYTGSPFTGISPSGKQIFLNGQKIYEGVNYSGTTEFYPFGSVTGELGVYYAIPQYTGDVLKTGFYSDDSSVYSNHGVSYKPKSRVVFINGIRSDLSDFFDHDVSKDLVTGVNVSVEGLGYTFSEGFLG